MAFPLSFEDISFLLAAFAIILLITSALLSPYYGKINILINKKKLRNVTITVSILFIATLVIRIAGLVLPR